EELRRGRLSERLFGKIEATRELLHAHPDGRRDATRLEPSGASAQVVDQRGERALRELARKRGLASARIGAAGRETELRLLAGRSFRVLALVGVVVHDTPR